MLVTVLIGTALLSTTNVIANQSSGVSDHHGKIRIAVFGSGEALVRGFVKVLTEWGIGYVTYRFADLGKAKLNQYDAVIVTATDYPEAPTTLSAEASVNFYDFVNSGKRAYIEYADNFWGLDAEDPVVARFERIVVDSEDPMTRGFEVNDILRSTHPAFYRLKDRMDG